MRYLVYLCIICSFKQVAIGQSQGVTNAQTKLRPNQLRWSPTDATLDSVYIIRADTSTGEPGWYLVTLSGGGGVQDTTLAGDVVGGLNSTFVRKINGVTVENITPQNREVLTYNGTQWTPDSIALEDLPQMNASRVLGRGSSSAGAVTQLTPSNGVKISGNYIESDLTAGTGINISGTTTLTVSNSAPDQTVTISGATGTYPNFTVTPTSPGGASGQVQYNNAGSFGALDSFTVSANPDRVGIGVPSPTARLDIQGSGSTSATNALRVRNSSGTNLLTVRNDGKFSFGSSGQIYIESFSPSSYYHILGVNGSAGNYTEVYRPSGSGTFSIENAGKDISLSTPASAGSYSGADGMVIKGTTSYIGFGINTPLATAHFAKNTTASTPSILLSGTGYSGGTATTTKPTLLIEPTGTTSTGWSTSGTKLGVNAESGFSGNLLDLQVNGVSKVSVSDATNTVDINGSGSTSATNALRVRNLSATNLLTIANDGLFTVGGTRDLATNSDNVFNFNGSYTLNSGLTAYNTNSVFRFAPTITSNLTTARPVSFAITPAWAGTSDTRVAMFLSNTSVAPSTSGTNSSLFISNTGTSQIGAYISMGASASTTGLSIDQTAVPILIHSVNTSGIAINIQPSGTSNIHTPLRAYQAAAGSIGLPIILQARNTTAGNTSIYSALSLQNTSTSSSASALGANAGVGIDFVIQNASGASARTATIQAVAPDQSTLSNVIDLRMQTVDNTGTANTTLISKGATGFLGVNTASPNSTLHASGSVAMAYRAITTLRTLDATDYTIEVTANTFTVTLPTAVGISGRVYVITNSGSGVTTIATTSSQTFVNVTATPTTITLNQFGTVTVQSNGTNWIRLTSL